ncbi:MAG: hypothetical protein ABSF29_12190 [Tepidisphaeraceae bacterium]|jgi:hypothetical protein
MDRLDSHILAVRNKLTLAEFLRIWGQALLYLAVIVWMAVLAQKAMNRLLPHTGTLFWIGLSATVLTAAIWSLAHRPTPYFAAVALDHELHLKEKFSTALHVRPSDDPFAKAVVLDAQQTAQAVSLHQKFPLKFPRSAGVAAAIFLAALLMAWLLPPMHLLATSPPNPAAVALTADQTARDKLVSDQLPRIEQGAKLLGSNDAIQRASADLEKAAHTTDGDELHARRSALAALQDYQKAIRDELQKNQEFQNAQTIKESLSQMGGAIDESTPMGKAQNDLKTGDLDSAMSQIATAVNDFNKMTPDQQQKMIQQAQQMSQQLSRAANDPATGRQIAQQLMQMGASQAMAQRMSAAMQQAAAGDKQAAQQLQQMARQMSQQMNNGQGPTSQQQQRMQSMMAKAQALANSQAQAGALSSAAQQLAGAMSQAQGTPQPGHPGQQPGPGQSNPQLSQAGQNLQQQLQQMQAQAKDAQAMKAAADASSQAAADAAAGLNPGGPGSGNGQDQTAGSSNSQPQISPGQDSTDQNSNTNSQAQGQGQGAGGKGPGGAKNPDMVETPYHMQQVVDPSKDIDGGRILASRYVKAGIDPGQSTAGLKAAAVSGEQDEPDDIEQDHVSRDAQQAVKDYFSSIQQQQQ